MSDFVKYTTREGDRWDTVAAAVYGDPGRWKPIIDANPSLPLRSNLDPGLALRIPVLARVTVSPNTVSLPPWKQ